jgi:hypothetical protein
MISVEVRYIDSVGNPIGEDKEVSRIFIVSETEHAVILSVETETKYPQPMSYSSCGVRFRAVSGNICDIVVDGIPFEYPMIIAEPGRYQLYVVIFHDVPNDAKQIYEKN